MDNEGNKSAWIAALWSLAFVALGIIVTSFVVAFIIGFHLSVLLDIFKVWWLAYLIILASVYIIVFLVIKYPLGTISISLFTIAFMLVLAAPKKNDLAIKLSSAINGFIDINLLLGAFTILAFLLAFYAIYRDRRNDC